MTALQLQILALVGCHLSPASLPALMRILESCSLKALTIFNGNMPLFVGASVPAFCTALRASRLVRFAFHSMRLWESLADGLAVMLPVRATRCCDSSVSSTTAWRMRLEERLSRLRWTRCRHPFLLFTCSCFAVAPSYYAAPS